MQKGVVIENTENALTFLKKGESVTVGVISLAEVVTAEMVSAYDNATQSSIFLPVTLKNGEKTLYHDLVELLWSDYNELINNGVDKKDPKVKEVLRLINMIKPETYIFFGFKDINTGKDIVLNMKFKKVMRPDDKPSAGNNLMNGLAQCEDHFDIYPLTLTKGAMGAWQVMPYLKPLTEEQKENFANKAELPIETYTECMYFSNTESEKENLAKFGEATGFDVSRLGISMESSETIESNGIVVNDDDLPF